MQRLIIGILLLASTTLNISCNSRSGNRKSADTTKTAKSPSSEYLLVTKIVDGDTFWADNGTKNGIKVRLIGVDAPESRKTFKKEIGYYGKEAKIYLTKMLTGKKVKLVGDVDSLDQYGRTLSYVYLEDGTFVNADLMRNGYAMVMTIPPNVKFAQEFVELQREAREGKRGLWADR